MRIVCRCAGMCYGFAGDVLEMGEAPADGG